MEEDSWVCVEEISSGNENFSDSDNIDSETEAELYSLIHFEGNLSSVSCQSSETKNVSEPKELVLSDKMKYVLSTEKREHNGEIEFVGNSNIFLQSGDNEFAEMENSDKTVSNDSLLKIFNENGEIIDVNHTVPTNLLIDSNSNELTETHSKNDRNKRKFDSSPPNYSSPPKKVSSDCGRNSIWVDVDSSKNKDIQTNICEDEDDDILFISSDSETDPETPSQTRITPHLNMSMPNIKIGENSKDLWFVNQEDIIRARSIKSRRYHDKFDITCSNCNRKGHHNRNCPLPKSVKCFICGGEHIGSACKNRVCGKCYGIGHDRRSCSIAHVNSCELCHMQGHIKQNCPDLWRRYHLTTQPGKIVPDKKIKQSYFVFCCKCGRPGHFGAVCNIQHGGYKNSFSTWPNVLSYDDPYSLPVQTLNTSGNKQNIKKKDLVVRRKKKNPNENVQLSRKEKKLMKFQGFLNATAHKNLKEKDFPRTPKNKSETKLSSPRSQGNNSATNVFNSRTLEDDSVVILPTPKTKKNISVIDLTSPKVQKNNSVVDLIPPKTSKKNSVVNLISRKTQKNYAAFEESNDVPESVKRLMMKRAKRREKNRRRRLNKRQNFVKERNQSKNTIT